MKNKKKKENLHSKYEYKHVKINNNYIFNGKKSYKY